MGDGAPSNPSLKETSNLVSKGVCLHRKGPGDKAVVSSIEGAGPKIGDPLLLKTGEAQFRGSDLVGPESITDGPVYDIMDSTSSGLGSTVGIDTGQAVAIAFLSTVFHF
ncbi:hypothetical protein ACOSQ2_021122 [Xanthoceras sorbifolium]